MKKNIFIYSMLWMIIWSCMLDNGWTSPLNEFPEPEFLKDNITFWKTIYVEVSVTEGLIHDREFPLIIYKKIHIGNKRGKALDELVEKEKMEIRIILKRVLSVSPSYWSQVELDTITLFQKYASMEDLKSAADRLRFQQGQRERFKAGLERSGMYMNEIFSILRQHQLPLRLAYLPHVESSFNTKAISKAGAVGLWQFMPATGKRYLKINRDIDERKDPILSTIAASKLLKKNYDVLKSWPLAITAYNYGLAGIQRAIEETNSTDISRIIQNHRSKSFQVASKNFYSCFLAACSIDENFHYYFKNAQLNAPLLRQRLPLSKPMTPQFICDQLNLSLESFKQLNPAIRSSVYGKRKNIQKGYPIFIPLSISLADASQRLNSINPHKRMVHKRYHVNKGERLEQIAKKTGVDLNEIVSANNIDHKDRIVAGEDLIIPLVGDDHYDQSSHNNNSKNDRDDAYYTYTIQMGDTLWDIARITNIPEKKIAEVNRLTHNLKIYPGQKLLIPYKKQSEDIAKETDDAIEIVQAISDENKTEKQDAQPYVINMSATKQLNQSIIQSTYTVTQGENIWLIANQTGVPVADIMNLNKLTSNDRIYPGQVLILYQETTIPKSVETKQLNPVVSRPISQQPQAEMPKKKIHIISHHPIKNELDQKKPQPIIKKKQVKPDNFYIVKKGDTIWGIAHKLNMSYQSILNLNQISHVHRLQTGQKLRIPSQPIASLKPQVHSKENNQIQAEAKPLPQKTTDNTKNQLIEHNQTVAKHETKPTKIENKSNEEEIKASSSDTIVIDYYYKVKEGDTLSSISQTTGVAIERIAIVNHLTPKSKIYHNQVLRIPEKKEPVNKASRSLSASNRDL